MVRACVVLGLIGVVGCSVDSEGFPGVMSSTASASASASASATASAGGTESASGSGGTASDTAGTAASDGATVTPDGTAGDTVADDATATGLGSGDSGGTTFGGSDSGGTAGVGECAGMPLDPQLSVPPLCAPTCQNIGFGTDCPGIDICRLKDSATAVCETCAPCGNLNAPCTASAECDILFTCFMGQCTAMCDFNTPQTCGNPMACTDVGHPTHGVCDPTI